MRGGKPYSLEKLAERFWARVDKSGGPDACWPWMATRLPEGYGLVQASAAGLKYPAGTHRVAYWLTHGGEFPIDPVCVLHSCDNPPCCNPAHLSCGDRVANYADMRAKGRRKQKFNADHIREIRRKSADGKRDAELAIEYGTNPPLHLDDQDAARLGKLRVMAPLPSKGSPG